MKDIAVPDSVHAALTSLAAAHGTTPADLLTQLFTPAAPPATPAAPVAHLLAGMPGADRDEAYLFVLTWLARNHDAEFSDFVEHRPNARRYLAFSARDTLAFCRQHSSRQIDGTRFWAVLDLPPRTKRRFLADLLDFIGYAQLTIDIVCATVFDATARMTGVRAA